MPIFEFDCQDCRKQFELLVGIGKNSAANRHMCPACRSSNIKKRFSKFGVRSTGGGQTSSSGSSCTSCSSSNCGTCSNWGNEQSGTFLAREAGQSNRHWSSRTVEFQRVLWSNARMIKCSRKTSVPTSRLLKASAVKALPKYVRK